MSVILDAAVLCVEYMRCMVVCERKREGGPGPGLGLDSGAGCPPRKRNGGGGPLLDTEHLDGVRCRGWITWVLLSSTPATASRLPIGSESCIRPPNRLTYAIAVYPSPVPVGSKDKIL
ncbi:hypothetical protein V6N12_040439 [Hibiscus sabdariffa]|uniref:Uncharacterized protein n=1 Tax=Hibiscus sabdariffa TaxID=183260 RepID=A0ABR2E489_9ROSI